MMRRPARFLPRLARDCRGVTTVEFALVAPPLFLLLLGLFELGFQVYAGSVLQGAVQQAARNATLESGAVNLSALDEAVRRQVRNVIPFATLTFKRTNYARFSDVSQAERFTDTNGDGLCNAGEPFEDLNGNRILDDRGRSGLGGGRDAVLYLATASYDRMFPLHALVGMSDQVTVDAATVLRNQPFQKQAVRVAVVANCV